LKILNLYAGLGGNRKLWSDENEITAVEIDPIIAEIYKDRFKNDNVIVANALDYLLNHFAEYDFIWASPPCPTHSRMNLVNISRFKSAPRYVDMSLYQIIIFLKTYYKGLFCVENVISYYEPLIKPQILGSHYIWANFSIPKIKIDDTKIRSFRKKEPTASERLRNLGMPVKNWHGCKNKETIANNTLHPKFGLHILECSQVKELFK